MANSSKVGVLDPVGTPLNVINPHSAFASSVADRVAAYINEAVEAGQMGDSPSANNDDDVMHEVGDAVVGAINIRVSALRTSNQKEQEIKREEKGLQRQKTQRPAVLTPQEGFTALVDMKAEAERKIKFDVIGVDPKTFLRLDVSTSEALGCTTKIMTKMLLNVAALMACVALCTTIVASDLDPRTLFVSAKVQFGMPDNRTDAELADIPEFKEVLSDETNRAAILSAGIWTVSSVWLSQVVFGYFACAANMARIALFLALLHATTPLGCYLVYEKGGSYINGAWASAFAIVMTGLATVVLIYEILSSRDSEAGAGIVKMAGKRAEYLLQSDGSTELTTRTQRQKFKLAVISGVPVLFILGVILIYVTVIFAAFEYRGDSTWKAVVTIIAMGVKIVGNKALLKMVVGSTPWTVDWTLFIYEFSTATLLRVLQMSIPNENVAINLSLFGAVLEVCVRIFFFIRYVHAGMKTNYKNMTKQELYNYARWGRMRVMDGTNDMIVEYMSSLTAALLLIQIVPTGAFGFAGTQVVPTALVLKLTMYQLAPELFLDFYVTFMEVQGGLIELHEVQWDTKAGSDQESKVRANRIGTSVKAGCVKAANAVTVVALVLLSNAK
jgi:hypothetical protein